MVLLGVGGHCAACTDDASLPECDPPNPGEGGISVGRNPVAEPAELTVVQADSVLRLEADPHQDPPDEREVDVSGLGVIPNDVALPRVGDEVVVLGLSCEVGESWESYARISSAAGELLFEGGFPPMCVQDDPPASWQPPPRLRVRRPAHGHSCRAGSCSAEAWEVVLAADEGEISLSFGEPQEASVGGRRFLALAYYAHDLGSCGVVGGVGPVASAFIAPLTEQ